MSLSVNGSASISNYLQNSSNNTKAVADNTATGYQMSSDSFTLSSTTDPNQLPTEAGGWKKFSDSVGSMFSSIADSLGFGETRQLLRQEFNQVDTNKNLTLDHQEFNIATLNLFDFWGTEFARADKNRDGLIQEKEYANYREEQLSMAFDRRDNNMDHHLTVNEFGFIGQQMLQNRDPRLDENDDGYVNKREFTRASLRGVMNLRDWLSNALGG